MESLETKDSISELNSGSIIGGFEQFTVMKAQIINTTVILIILELVGLIIIVLLTIKNETDTAC